MVSFIHAQINGDIRAYIENICFHGADDVILVDAHPHIGTNKLPKIIQNMRNNNKKHGGEVHLGLN